MAKSKNHTNHNQNQKAHKNGEMLYVYIMIIIIYLYHVRRRAMMRTIKAIAIASEVGSDTHGLVFSRGTACANAFATNSLSDRRVNRCRVSRWLLVHRVLTRNGALTAPAMPSCQLG